ncbi:hypothetical protein KKH65_05975, partial [bacterium]|nr:hypothetical protein [bacterium]
ILKGPNSINDIVLLRYTTGVARYAKQKGVHKVAIGYDSRIAGEQFAEMIAQCFIGQSVPEHKFITYLFDEASPFPELSFGLTTKALRADLGILISASHNPSDYNGYKITDYTGSQLSQRMKNEVKVAIEATKMADIELKSLEEAEEGQLIWLGGREPLSDKDYKGVDLNKYFIDMHTLHVEQVKKFILDKELIVRQARNIKIGFSAFNGAGYKAVPRLLKELGFSNVKVISKLQELDGLFPAFGWGEQPDPGDSISADIAVREFIAEHGQAAFDELDILIGTDPDADRMGLIVKVPQGQQALFGKYRLLSANDAWTLLIWYRLMKKKELGLLDNPENHYITFSHVTTDALEATVCLFGVRSLGEMYDKDDKEERGHYLDGKRSWVGFTYIADFANKMRAKGFINEAGAEESNGFSILGGKIREGKVLSDDGHVNDKDGTFAGLLLAEVACYAKDKNTSIFELLDNIYLQTGHYATANKPLPRVGSFEGAEGITEKINLLKKTQEWMIQANERWAYRDSFILGGQKVIGALEFKSGRYDEQHYPGFPDEGIRFFFEDSTLEDGESFYKSKNFITIRPSGTSQTIRFYTQIFSRPSKDKIAEQKYRNFRLAESLALTTQKELLLATGLTKYIPNIEEQLEKEGFDINNPTGEFISSSSPVEAKGNNYMPYDIPLEENKDRKNSSPIERITGVQPENVKVVVFDWDGTISQAVPWVKLMTKMALSEIYPGSVQLSKKQYNQVESKIKGTAGWPITKQMQLIRKLVIKRGGIAEAKTVSEYQTIYYSQRDKFLRKARNSKNWQPLLPYIKKIIIDLHQNGIDLYVLSGKRRDKLAEE